MATPPGQDEPITRPPAPRPRLPGRPKGSKDGPRPENAPPRGRPKKQRCDSQKAKPNAYVIPTDDLLFDDYFGDEQLTDEYIEAFDALSGLSASVNPAQSSESGTASSTSRARTLLDEAVRRSHIQPFFTSKSTVYDDGYGSDSEGEDDEIQDQAPVGSSSALDETNDGKPWFRKPVQMPDWLYQFFGRVIKPMISRRKKNSLDRPPSYETGRAHAPASFWVMPPDPAFMLARREFNIKNYYQPRVYLWLPHFFAAEHKLTCPNCKAETLEKNGPTPPRRVVDINDNFWIVTWQYYCRKGCKSYFSGWSTKLLETLPRYLRLSFPAVLSRRGGLSHNVITLLRVANQHKMGPSGVRALLVEQHTLRYNQILLQYLEAVLEVVQGSENHGDGSSQPSIHAYLGLLVSDFGDFWDSQKFGGFVPTDSYLAGMMNRAIEKDEAAAAQHTSLLAPDQIAIDDSHKITKHIAKIDSVPVFTALWTVMDSRYIRGQVLALTKAHDERLGPLMAMSRSMKVFGYREPPVAFSDDPVKDKALLYSAFPSLARGLTPMAHAYGLEELTLPLSTRIVTLDSPHVIEAKLSSLLDPLDCDPQATLVIGFDAEWNISRTSGVSIIQLYPQSRPDEIYIIPVYRINHLPPSLLRVLISPNVYKKTFNLVDLKEFCIQQGIVERKRGGTLDGLLKETHNKYLLKDETLRRCDDWELYPLRRDLLCYAALDAYASLLVFEEAKKRVPPTRITSDTAAGTRVVLYTQEGGFPAALGKIADSPPATFQGVRVKVPSGGRVLISIDEVLLPSAAATLHFLPGKRSGRNKAGTYTLSQLQNASGSAAGTFQMVALVSHLDLYDPQTAPVVAQREVLAQPPIDPRLMLLDGQSESSDDGSDEDPLSGTIIEENENPEAICMLEAYTAVSNSLEVWEKAKALLELARQGYYSDLDDVPMYEKAGVDKYGLQKWKCLRGTNNVEGGPHGDIYRKFGALNAGPRFTVNCLTDHRTWYNLQAFASHVYNVDWEYHHSIPMINRTSFLLNYLSDRIGGAQSYRDWVNGDLYEQTEEAFGICPLPESLRIRYCMESHSEATCAKFAKLNASDDWLRKRQGLALPVIPPTTLVARKYFFSKLHSFSEAAVASGRKKIDFEAFSQEWNRTADGKDRFYITPEVLSAYAKSWEKPKINRSHRISLVAPPNRVQMKTFR
ncbi:hypothetical protein H1R20_g16236, partial [Candolleomyces eurysporus]